MTKHLTQLKRLGRKFSKKHYDPQTKTSSRNREKLKLKLARLHDEIACIRTDAHHKLATELARTCSVVGIEDLHVKGMFKNRKPLKYRTFICLKCGLHIDRDFNAAINLCTEAQRLLALEAFEA